MKRMIIALDGSDPALAPHFAGEGSIEKTSGEALAWLWAALAATGRS